MIGFRKGKGITSVDISNSRIRAIVATKKKEENIDILAAEEDSLSSLNRSIVADLNQTAQALKDILYRIKRNSHIDNHYIYLNISGGHLDMTTSHGAVVIKNSRHQVRQQDIDNVIMSAYIQGVSLDRTPIHSLVCGYTIDEQDRVLNPINMQAEKLEVDLSIISSLSNHIKNLRKSVNQAGYEVREFIASAIASSHSVLTEEEKRSGVILMDIGAGVTDLAFFKDNYLKGFKVLLKGGDDITSLLSDKLKISLSYAEEIKKRYGCIYLEKQEIAEDIILKDANSNFKNITRSQICNIIKEGLMYLFSEIKTALRKMDCLRQAPVGIVITGGAGLLDGLIERAQEEFNLPVRLGLPREPRVLKDLNNPGWSTCLGIARYVLFKEKTPFYNPPKPTLLSYIKRKIEILFTDYF